jgi:hypothetical protein
MSLPCSVLLGRADTIYRRITYGRILHRLFLSVQCDSSGSHWAHYANWCVVWLWGWTFHSFIVPWSPNEALLLHSEKFSPKFVSCYFWIFFFFFNFTEFKLFRKPIVYLDPLVSSPINLTWAITNNDNPICPVITYNLNFTLPESDWKVTCEYPELVVAPRTTCTIRCSVELGKPSKYYSTLFAPNATVQNEFLFYYYYSRAC